MLYYYIILILYNHDSLWLITNYVNIFAERAGERERESLSHILIHAQTRYSTVPLEKLSMRWRFEEPPPETGIPGPKEYPGLITLDLGAVGVTQCDTCPTWQARFEVKDVNMITFYYIDVNIDVNPDC